MSWLKKNKTNLILILILLTGIGIMAYPSFADWWNSYHQAKAVASYAEAVANLDASKYSEILESAERYNAHLPTSAARWNMTEEQQSAYNVELAINDSGIMGYIDIPKIRITLPIYHGTSEEVLQVAVGHIAGTSLPVGGAGTHSVLSGHRGLPSARLFTDIDKMAEGDTFTITVLNRTLTYEVDQIRIVEPTDLSSLQIEQGKDYCTLVTCTPYGINTHRLLVRGHRIANANGEANVIADALQIEPIYVAPAVAVPMIIILLILLLVMTSKRFRDKIRRD